MDPAVECLSGEHWPYFIIGAVLLLAYSVGYLIFIIVTLLRNKSRFANLRFRTRFGFLFASYKPHFYLYGWFWMLFVCGQIVSLVQLDGSFVAQVICSGTLITVFLVRRSPAVCGREGVCVCVCVCVCVWL